jgi:hypothetical protein
MKVKEPDEYKFYACGAGETKPLFMEYYIGDGSSKSFVAHTDHTSTPAVNADTCHTIWTWDGNQDQAEQCLKLAGCEVTTINDMPVKTTGCPTTTTTTATTVPDTCVGIECDNQKDGPCDCDPGACCGTLTTTSTTTNSTTTKTITSSTSTATITTTSTTTPEESANLAKNDEGGGSTDTTPPVGKKQGGTGTDKPAGTDDSITPAPPSSQNSTDNNTDSTNNSSINPIATTTDDESSAPSGLMIGGIIIGALLLIGLLVWLVRWWRERSSTKRLARLGLHTTAVMNAAYAEIEPDADAVAGAGAGAGADVVAGAGVDAGHARAATNNSTGSRFPNSNNTYDMQAPRRGARPKAQPQQQQPQPQYAEIDNYAVAGQPAAGAAPMYAVTTPHGGGGLRAGGGKGKGKSGEQPQYNTLASTNRLSGNHSAANPDVYSEFSDYQPAAAAGGGGGGSAVYATAVIQNPNGGGAAAYRGRSGSLYEAGKVQRDRAGTLTLNATQDGVKYHVPFAAEGDGAGGGGGGGGGAAAAVKPTIVQVYGTVGDGSDEDDLEC